MVQGNFFMFLQLLQNKKLNIHVLSVISGIFKNHRHEDLFLRKCAALVASFLNTIYSCWSKQCHNHRNPRKHLPKIRSGFLESTPILSPAYLEYLKLEPSVKEINIIVTGSYKSLFVSCQTPFKWPLLCSSAWFSFEIICFTQCWGNPVCSTKHCLSLLWNSIHPEELAQPFLLQRKMNHSCPSFPLCLSPSQAVQCHLKYSSAPQVATSRFFFILEF